MPTMLDSKVPESIMDLFNAKPPGPQTIGELVTAVESVPRFGPTAHAGSIGAALGSLGIQTTVGQGAFWGQVLTENIRQKVNEGWRYVLILDFDTVFTAQNVLDLFNLMQANPDIDALSSLQIGREKMRPLFVAANAEGQCRQVGRNELRQPTLKIATSNFALTLFRSSSLKKLKTPWFQGVPAPDGFWGEGRMDADIHFWKQWGDSGLSLHQANYVVVGHLENVVSWPDNDLRTVYQSLSEYGRHSIPSTAFHWRSQRIVGDNEEIRLNVGSGESQLDGYEPIDRIFGDEAYPLNYPDNSVVEVLASHLLEHFDSAEVIDVLKDWVRVLRPGGLLRIAVPDLEKVLDLRTTDPSWLRYLLGTGGSGYHKSAFTQDELVTCMTEAGVEAVRPWTREPISSAAYPFSLNLEGLKP